MAALTPVHSRPRSGLVAVAVEGQWNACSHTSTVVDEDKTVCLQWVDPDARAHDGELLANAGLAVDQLGCLYHSITDEGRIQRVPWSGGDPFAPRATVPPPIDILAPVPRPDPGRGFRRVDPAAAIDLWPGALAVDTDEHLFVVDQATGNVLVFDLGEGRLARRIRLAAPAVDLAPSGRRVVIATSDPDTPLWVVEAQREPDALEVPAPALANIPGGSIPRRVAVGPDGEIWLLVTSGAHAFAVPVVDDRVQAALGPFDGVGDIELDGHGTIVLAGTANGDFRRVPIGIQPRSRARPLRARGYDGRGITRLPDGGIGYWTEHGFRAAVNAAVAYASPGHVDTFRLDGEQFHQTWGRLFVDACIPNGTRILVATVTTDDPPADGQPPSFGAPRPLHRRELGNEQPWSRVETGDRFETYEAPVMGGPGRYLWVQLELHGSAYVTPRVRALRAEFPGHDLLHRLPRVYSQDPAAASFLHRYLAMIDGQLADLEARADARDALLDPEATPIEALHWLAGFVGLALDDRWSESARRQLVAEAACLWRQRGTVKGLLRMIKILIDCDAIIIERFRLRGLAGALLGGDATVTGSSVLGAGFRVGDAALGRQGDDDAPSVDPDRFASHAHRFTLILPVLLDEEREAALATLLERHRPAHTAMDICTVGVGMRVGVGLHLELSSVIGPSAGFTPAVVGDARVGRGTIVGRPRAGIRPESSRLGHDSRLRW